MRRRVMEKRIGIWIDRRKALIVALNGEETSVQTIVSQVERQTRLSGGSRSASPYGPQDVASESRMGERLQHQMRRYLQDVIKAVRRADAIVVFGPGEAKQGLTKEIHRIKALAPHLVAVERSDKMTVRQFVAKVRRYFGS
jgi:stalled ribosome rescue protein Dom34